ncbi:MAG: sigma-54-dependent Fis family transcriptional regulator [Bdellovibrionaceae bacterium]|nr:sigma-54-dependent Fis family transcriptional regulator [Pseudobdellovibrionaceae bacterium]MBX3033049.1 sigma-54-dependent Fis family transcriptional regulator [Pseudobdellovibrionaceae bacterium]
MSEVDFSGLEIRNKKMQDAIETVRAVAPTPAPLLIIGAAGTGKTSLARWTHQRGRPGRPLAVLSGAEATEASLKSALSEVRDGTLVIEDVDLGSDEFHAALVRELEQKNSQPCRWICTSRRHLRSLARQDQFRQDLYYKISVVTVEIPSLEQRKEDLISLALFLVQVNAILHGKRNLNLNDEARDRILSWSWPGNIRELENVIERAVALTAGEIIGGEMIRFDDRETRTGSDLGPGMSLSEVEQRLIIQTLELTAQNRTRAAQMLGISIRTLRNKLNEYKEAGVV